jgi:exodeoxyribonuclease VII large subunit
MIAASPLPFISAVGHETDFTICDFVSSKRAPTPSGAAELAVPDMAAVKDEFNAYLSDMQREMKRRTQSLKERLLAYENKKVLRSPYGFIDEKRLRLDTLSDRLETRAISRIDSKKSEFSRIAGRLDALSPLAVLSRGYGALYSENGEVLTETDQVKVGDKISIRLKDGKIGARAESITQENEV